MKFVGVTNYLFLITTGYIANNNAMMGYNNRYINLIYWDVKGFIPLSLTMTIITLGLMGYIRVLTLLHNNHHN